MHFLPFPAPDLIHADWVGINKGDVDIHEGFVGIHKGPIGIKKDGGGMDNGPGGINRSPADMNKWRAGVDDSADAAAVRYSSASVHHACYCSTTCPDPGCGG